MPAILLSVLSIAIDHPEIYLMTGSYPVFHKISNVFSFLIASRTDKNCVCHRQNTLGACTDRCNEILSMLHDRWGSAHAWTNSRNDRT